MAVSQSDTLQGFIVNVIVMLILVVWIENFRNSSKGYCKKICMHYLYHTSSSLCRKNTKFIYTSSILN